MEENVKALFEKAIETFMEDKSPVKKGLYKEKGHVSTEAVTEAIEGVMGEDCVSRTDVSLWMKEHEYQLEILGGELAWIVYSDEEYNI
jgi:hypothetical protein